MKHNIPHIVSKVFNEPWLITRARHHAIQKLVMAKLAGDMPMPDMPVPGDEDEPDDGLDMAGGTMVIPVHGIIGKHLSALETMCGGCDLDEVNMAIDMARKDDTCRRVVFDFQTPGGTVTGVPETADKIAQLNATKETIAFTDTECCSAGYWLASQCGAFYCSPSSTVGSVGVYMALLDESRALAKQGVTVNEISAGKYKCAGAPWKPLTDEERKMFQDSVDKIATQFKAAVRRNRELPANLLEGQCFDGDEAVAQGLADGLADGLEDVL